MTICQADVRTFDVAFEPLPSQCPIPVGANSVVNASDLQNPECSFRAHFGVVTPGVNSAWDIDCNGLVNATDVQGTICRPCGSCGNWYQHRFHARAAEASGCP